MNIFKFDSPVMQFIGKVADFIILNLLTLVLSIPIFTFGAAYTAKYYVSMKIVRGEEGTLFKPYFKSFKDNFKQATIIWMIQLAAIVLLGLDWLWIYNKGFKNVNEIYMVALGVLTLFVIFITITIFPFIARFEMTIKEAFKGAGLFSFLYFIKLFLVVALEIGSIVAAVWYAEWLPAILIFGTTTAFYFMNLTLVKGFTKLEAKVEKEEAEKKEEEKKASEEYTAGESELGESIVLRPDEHTVKGKIEAEKATFKSLTFKEKIQFIKDYYLLKIVLGIIVTVFALWFAYDAFVAQKEMLYSGGLLYCIVDDDGRKYLTDDFFDKIATKKRKQQVNLSEDLTMTLVEQDLEVDQSQDQLLYPMIVAGYYDYFLIDAKFIDYYSGLDCYKDISSYADIYGISEEDRYIYVPEPEGTNDENVDSVGETGTEENAGEMVAIKLPEEVCERIGVQSLSGEGVYLALVLNDKPVETDEEFFKHVFGK